jgi:hypothetical protein
MPKRRPQVQNFVVSSIHSSKDKPLGSEQNFVFIGNPHLICVPYFHIMGLYCIQLQLKHESGIRTGGGFET